MLVKINGRVFALASDVISIKKVSSFSSSDCVGWAAIVKCGGDVIQYPIPDAYVDKLVSQINEVLGK